VSNAFSLSIVTPVFNEEPIIENTVKTNLQLLRHLHFDFEILIVNDGSTDGSASIIDRCFSGIPEIKVIHKPVNEGFGSTVKTGIESARKEYILCIPADSPLTEEILELFVNSAPKADIIVSYRIERPGYNWRMNLNSVVYHFIIKNLFNLPLRDFNWIHLYHRRIFDERGVTITSKGIFMLAEVLIAAKKKGCTFYEIPMRPTQRITGVATASKFTTIIKTVQEMAVYYFG